MKAERPLNKQIVNLPPNHQTSFPYFTKVHVLCDFLKHLKYLLFFPPQTIFYFHAWDWLLYNEQSWRRKGVVPENLVNLVIILNLTCMGRNHSGWEQLRAKSGMKESPEQLYFFSSLIYAGTDDRKAAVLTYMCSWRIKRKSEGKRASNSSRVNRSQISRNRSV